MKDAPLKQPVIQVDETSQKLKRDFTPALLLALEPKKERQA